MKDSPDGFSPITPPREYSSAKAAKLGVKAIAGSIPAFGAALTELVDGLLPDPEANDRKRWENQITGGVNGLFETVENLGRASQERLVTYSGAPAFVARYLVEKCVTGIPDPVDIKEIVSSANEFTREDIENAVAELEADGLVRDLGHIGAPGLIRLNDHAYEALDKPIMGWDTVEDARTLARYVVEHREEDAFSAFDLEKAMGWPRRRFNPALRVVVSYVACISRELQPYYVTTCFYPNSTELVKLKRFAAGAN